MFFLRKQAMVAWSGFMFAATILYPTSGNLPGRNLTLRGHVPLAELLDLAARPPAVAIRVEQERDHRAGALRQAIH